MVEAVDRHMSLGYAFYAPDDFVYHAGKTVSAWREEYNTRWVEGLRRTLGIFSGLIASGYSLSHQVT